MTAADSIAASNAGNFDLHLALHSNAAPEGQYGTSRGSIAFYYPGSIQGKWAADIIANNLRSIYPLPDKVRAVSTTTLGEVRKVRAPAVLLELAFHDNPDDAAWIKNNLDEIARNLVLSVTEFFGLPFLTPIPARSGMVDVNWGSLNIRSRPSLDAPVLAQAPDGALLTIINQWQDWYLVNYNGTIGYAKDSFVTLTDARRFLWISMLSNRAIPCTPSPFPTACPCPVCWRTINSLTPPGWWWDRPS